MIRRPITLEDHSAAWLLIAQPIHARIAYELAYQWGVPPFARPQPSKTLLPTILRHDDGWREWEASPEVDQKTGYPYTFTEMPPDVAYRIWEASILACGDLGPLSQYLIAAHFIHLCQGGDSATTAEALRFLRDFGGRTDRWLAEWQQAAPATNTADVAHLALGYLQMFDALSLWICCAGRKEPFEFDTPEGFQVIFTPFPDGKIHVTPWPWLVPRLEIQLTACIVPARVYTDTDELASVEPNERTLAWSIIDRL